MSQGKSWNLYFCVKSNDRIYSHLEADNINSVFSMGCNHVKSSIEGKLCFNEPKTFKLHKPANLF